MIACIHLLNTPYNPTKTTTTISVMYTSRSISERIHVSYSIYIFYCTIALFNTHDIRDILTDGSLRISQLINHFASLIRTFAVLQPFSRLHRWSLNFPQCPATHNAWMHLSHSPTSLFTKVWKPNKSRLRTFSLLNNRPLFTCTDSLCLPTTVPIRNNALRSPVSIPSDQKHEIHL